MAEWGKKGGQKKRERVKGETCFSLFRLASNPEYDPNYHGSVCATSRRSLLTDDSGLCLAIRAEGLVEDEEKILLSMGHYMGSNLFVLTKIVWV